jgi:hypothetical protein
VLAASDGPTVEAPTEPAAAVIARTSNADTNGMIILFYADVTVILHYTDTDVKILRQC